MKLPKSVAKIWSQAILMEEGCSITFEEVTAAYEAVIAKDPIRMNAVRQDNLWRYPNRFIRNDILDYVTDMRFTILAQERGSRTLNLQINVVNVIDDTTNDQNKVLDVIRKALAQYKPLSGEENLIIRAITHIT